MTDLKELSDEIVVGLVKKDKEIFAELISRYQDKLLRYANYLVNDEALASDIVQDSFIKSFINLNSFDIHKKFSSWIYRIVHNEALNSIRKNKLTLPIDEFFDIKDNRDLEEDLIKKEIIDQTHQCLSKIPLKYKEPLSLYYLEEKSYQEVSDILRLPINTVATRISRAKSIMKKICLIQK